MIRFVEALLWAGLMVPGLACTGPGSSVADAADNPASLKESATLKGHTSAVNIVAFSPDGKTLASGSADNTVKLWDPATGKERTTLKNKGGLEIKGLAFSPDGKTLAAGSHTSNILLWELETGKVKKTLKANSGKAMNALAFSPDGKVLAAGGNFQPIYLFDVETGKNVGALGKPGSLKCLTFSPDGKTLASGSEDRTIILWDVATARERETFKGHTETVTSVAFSPDGKMLASGSGDGTIKLWDTATGMEKSTLKGPMGATVWSVAFSPDGKTLASGNYDNLITDQADRVKEVCKLWNVATGKQLAALAGHTSSIVRSVAFSPDGKTLASGCSDTTIKLWDVSSVN